MEQELKSAVRRKEEQEAKAKRAVAEALNSSVLAEALEVEKAKEWAGHSAVRLGDRSEMA